MKRLGLFGGSFDPPHAGHLLLAESAREELVLEKVFFIPARQSPLKGWSAFASPEERWTMVNLAVEDNSFFEASRVELDRNPPSYTVDTVNKFHRLFPEMELWLILGEDNLGDFHRWHRYRELLRAARVGVGKRPGWKNKFPASLEEYRQRIQFFSHPGIELSSQEIRERFQKGLSTRYRLPEKVRKYIESRRLYAAF